MSYRIETIPMTLSHFEGHSYCKPFKCDFSYSCAAVDNISTDTAHRGSVASCFFHFLFHFLLYSSARVELTGHNATSGRVSVQGSAFWWSR